MKTALTIIVSIVVTIAIVGAGGYYFIYKRYDSNKNNLQNQINNLNSKINSNSASTSNSTNSNSSTNPTALTPSATVDTTAWKTYTDKTYAFSFKYSNTWTENELEESYGDARKENISMTGSVTGKTYNAEVFSSSESVTDFLKSYYGKIQGGPIAVSTVTISNQTATQFYITETGSTAKSVTGTAYILFQKGSTLVSISTSGLATQSALMTDLNLVTIASTFTFN